MFKATLKEPKFLENSIGTIAELIGEGVFQVGEKGISFVAADRAMVSVVDFFLSASAFDKYEVEGEEKIGLNIPNFYSIIRRAGSDDKISFELKDAKLEVVIEGKSKRRFVVPLIDIKDEEIPPIGDLEFKSKAQLKSDILKNGLDDAQIIGDSVILKIGPEKFGMLAEGDITKAELNLEKGNESLMDLNASGNFKSRYALDYLMKMVKASKLSDDVTIEHGTDYPMKLSFASGDKVRLSFILAPRVTED